MYNTLCNSAPIGKLRMARSRSWTYIFIILTALAISLVSGQLPTCDNFNGGCSDICTPLSASGGVICSCTDNKTIANNDRVCVPPDATVCDGETQFTCADGEKCISLLQACDISADCRDASDEGTNYCYDHKCGVDQFRCDNGRCIFSQFKCDFYDDCLDNSDENQTLCAFVTCAPGDFVCANGLCISNTTVCNGFDECLDGQASDELGCPERSCPPGTVQCETSNICISPQWVCDGSNDCGDNSDEAGILCEARTCAPEDYLCQSGKCIPGSWFCDGEPDCPDRDDEIQDICNSPNFTCHTGLFTCDDGTCITEEWECDGIPECPDNSDEYRACPEYVCPENFYKCDQKKHLKNRCIPVSAVCDGEVDCAMGDDEFQNCTMRTCEPREFACRNGLCIRDVFLCDHENDCGDQSDEGSACNYTRCDPDDEFTCNNGRCVVASWRCDGQNDCRDNSDETGCGDGQSTCAAGEYMCGDGECILQELVCNNEVDCNDGLDEYRCGVNECENNATGCQHDCVNTANSYYCTCDTGFRLNPDKRTCAEIDECLEMPQLCSQVCENTIGAYLCKCVDGYTLETDGRSCKHNSGIDPLIIFSNSYYVRSLSLDGREYNLIADDFQGAVALDFDYKESRLFVLDVFRAHIVRMWMNGTDREVIIEDFVNGGEGMSVDWVGRKLYWVDSVNDVMEVAELDGSQRKTLVYTGMDQPRAVVVNPKYGYVYWTDPFSPCRSAIMIQSPTSSRDEPNLTVISSLLSLTSLTTSSLLLCVLVLVLVLVILTVDCQNSVTPIEDVVTLLPGPRGGLATIKVLLGMTKRASRYMFERAKTYGKVFGIGDGPDSYVIIMDYASLEEAFVTKADLCSDRGGLIQTMLESVLPERGSIFNNGTAWNEVRGFVAKTVKNPDFGATTISRRISETIPTLCSELDELVDGPFDPKRTYQCFCVDAFHRIAFGVGISYENCTVKKFINDLDTVVAQTLDPSALLLTRPSLINTFLFRGYRSKLQSSSSYVKTRAEEVLAKLDAPEQSSSLIALFVKYIEGIRSSGKASYSEPDDGWVIVYNMFFAAADTIHEVLLWVTLFIATRPDIQLRMRNEIDTVMDSVGSESLYDQRSRLPVVRSTILEVLRMRPVAPMGVPHVVSDTGSIDGYSIPKGSQIFPNIWGMHNDPDIWKDPSVFNPDRFLSHTGVLDEEKAKLVIPFSIGPRSCPGEQVARRIIFQTLVSLMSRYRISLPAGRPTPQLVNEERSFTMSPERFKVVFSRIQADPVQLKDLEIPTTE